MADEEKQNPFTVLVCGGGNAAQVATAMFAARYRTIAVSFFADEAAKWKAALGNDDYELTLDTGKVIRAKPDGITNDPSVAKEADAIVLAVPSFAHGQYFEAFQPYIKPDTVIACMPARSGGDILLAAKLGAKAKDCVFVGFETLPWACRFTEWGKKATILGTKGSILAAVTPPAKTPKAFAALQGLLGVFPNVSESPTNLGISLRNPGAVIHPGVMYGRWCAEKWDGKPVAEKPLFYQGVEDFTEQVLLGLTGEVQAIRKKMEELIPGLDLRDAVDLKQWYLDCYSGQMTDTSSLKRCMNTNPGYRGLTHPMKQVDGGWAPDLKYRYIAEDVPTGMCFNKGLAEILGIHTPMTDKVLAWAQECLDMKIMVNGKMCGPDVGKTRAPQAIGIKTLTAFLEAAKIQPGPPLLPKPVMPPPAESEEKNPFTVLVCGGGNAAQVATAMFAARYNTIAVSFFADEAEKWAKALDGGSYELTLDTGRKIISKPDAITNDPSVAAKADAIVLAVPSFAHGQYFEAFAPYMKPNTVVAVMPARSGGDVLFASKLGEKAKDMIFVGFETLPWACRFTEWGKKATILGTKGGILAAVTPPSKQALAFAVMQGLLGVFPNVSESPTNLGISLRNPGAVIHPGVMYGRWCAEKWDGKPVAEKPLFYQGVEDFTEQVLLGLTGEVQAIRKKLEQMIPGLDLRDAVDLKQWYLDCYSGQMTDTSSLKRCMNTNPGYRGLTHPMKQVDGGWVPDLKYRYIAEDVPTGMCFNKGLAEILGIDTPMTDKVLAWAQECLDMKIMVSGKMCGPDVGKTRAPQATGITTIEEFCAAASIEGHGGSPAKRRKVDYGPIPAMMKAAVVEEFGKPLRVKQVPVPEPGYGQVLIKVICSGVCHTDLHVRDADWHVKPKCPIIPGHEGAGVVVKLGPGVKNVQLGDRVGHAWLHNSCQGCDYCLSGWEAVCGKQSPTGFHAEGCFAEYTLAEAAYVGKIPDSLSFAQAAPILCAGVTTYKALKETEARPGQWVAVIGACGGLGHVGCQYAKAMGLKVCAVDFGSDKRSYALEKLKADVYVDIKDKKGDAIVAEVKKVCDGMGPHGVIILAPAPAAYRQGVDMLRPMGFAVGIALPPAEFPVDIFSMVLHRKTVRGSIVGSRKDLNECLQIAGEGKVVCTVDERKMEDINEIFEDMHHGKIKGRCVLRVAPY